MNQGALFDKNALNFSVKSLWKDSPLSAKIKIPPVVSLDRYFVRDYLSGLQKYGKIKLKAMKNAKKKGCYVK